MTDTITLYEYDQDGACVGSFEADPHKVVGSWLDHTNREINLMVDRINSECVLDYWSRKDPDYINHAAPMMCYVECEYHGPQIGSRGDYPHKGSPMPKGHCPECGADLSYAMREGIITERQLVKLSYIRREKLLRDKVYGKRPPEPEEIAKCEKCGK